jgi:L-alanine-DL-glutamate epimerase-like enolase superfamily enzyme
MKIARLAEGFNLPVTIHGEHDIIVHLLAACPNRSFSKRTALGSMGSLSTQWVLDQGMASAPMRPGHGVGFDWKAVAQLAP